MNVRSDITCLGILVADVIARPVERLPERGTLALVDEIGLRGGGGALNTSTWLAHWGVSVSAAGKVGADVFGDFVIALLDQRGIGHDGVIRDPRVATSATVVLVDAAGERTFLHLAGANGTVRADDFAPDTLYNGRWLLVTGALVMPALDGEPMASLFAEGRRRGVLTAIDTVFDATGRWDRVRPSLPHLDLLMAGIAEARGITGEQDPAEVAAALRRAGVGEVALKLGPAGCYAVGDGFAGYLAPVRVTAVDGTGAGDAFVAGMLYGKLAGWPFERCLEVANAAGAQATTAVGAADAVTGLREVLVLAEPGAQA